MDTHGLRPDVYNLLQRVHQGINRLPPAPRAAVIEALERDEWEVWRSGDDICFKVARVVFMVPVIDLTRPVDPVIALDN